MRKVIVIAAMVILPASGSSAMASGSLPTVATGAPPGNGASHAVRPHTIWFTGDSTGILGRIAKTVPAVGKRPGFLHWKSWTRQRAYAVGTEWYRSGGGAGAFHRTAVTVTLTDPHHGHFVKMTLSDRFGADTWCNYTGYMYWTLPSGPLGSTRCPGPYK